MPNKSLEGKNRSFESWVKRQNAGLWFGIGFLAFSVWFFVLSFDIPYQTKYGAGPGMYPRWLTGLSIVISLIYIWQSCTKQKFVVGMVFPGKKELFNVGTIFAGCLLLVLIMDKVGFNVASFLLLCITFFKQFKWWQTILLSVIITVACYFVFKVLFAIPLPVNRFGF